jgi:hypothetical protein
VFAKRIAIAFMLVKGYSYRQISGKIKVSTSTILKIADSISNNISVKKELDIIAKEESFKEFLNSIGYKLTTILPPKGGNWSAWRSRIEKEKNKLQNPF